MAISLPFYGNQSKIVWKSAETDHYKFTYPVEYQDRVGEIAAFAEAVHDSIELRYRVKLPGKSAVIIRNSLFSNGLASPISNTMNLWLTDWDFKVRSTHRWVYDVFTHEFSHLVSLQSGSKMAPWLYGLQISKESYANAKQTVDLNVQIPFAIFPLWFAEGTAQYESTRMGYDGWDTHRDMLIRTAILSDSLLPLASMRQFPDNSLHAELGPYTQGFSLVRFIAERFGDQAIPDLWSEMARVHRMTFTAACKAVLGISEEELYKLWKADRLAHYEKQKASLGTLREGKKRSKGAFWHDFLQVSNKALWGVSNFGSTSFEGGLFVAPLDSLNAQDTSAQAADSLQDSAKVWEMANFANSPFTLTKEWLEKGYSIRKDKGLIAYVSYQNRDRNGRAYFDIFVDDTTESPWFGERSTQRRVTKFADAIYPDLNHAATEVAFVRRESKGSRFVLSKVAVPSVGAPAEDYVDLFTPPDSALHFNIYTPKWSPNDSLIAFSFYDGKSRQIAVINAKKEMQIYNAGPWDSRDPAWSADGKTLYFASDKSGIFNIWKISLADSSAKNPVQVTHVLGGAFTPVEINKSLWYTGYDKEGFSIYELGLADSLSVISSAIAPRDSLSPVVSVGDLELQGISKPYSAIPTQPILVPLLSYSDQSDPRAGLRDSRTVTKAGVALGLMDALQKNNLQFALLLELGKGYGFIDQTGLNPAIQSDLYAQWENTSFPITWGLGYIRKNITSEDTVRYEDPRSHHDSLFAFSPYAITMQAIQANAGYSVFKKSDSLMVGLTNQSARFNLYQDGFFWDYLRSTSAFVSTHWYPTPTGQTGFSFTAQSTAADLYRPGTFQESFTITPEGILSPKYRHYTLHEAWFSASANLAVPFHAGARLKLNGNLSGILAWSGKDLGADTIDHFFHHNVQLAGYPMLADKENMVLHGDRTMQAELRYSIPTYSDLGAQLWIFTAKSLNIDLFAQVGTAWWNGASMLDQFKKLQPWNRSVGLEIQSQNSLFYMQDFHAYVQLAKGLDPVIQGQVPQTIGASWLPQVISPSSIRFGIGYSFAGSSNARK